MFGRFTSRRNSAVRPSAEKSCQPALEQVLDACLLGIQFHHKSRADCLHKYPSHADELGSLLAIAAELETLEAVSPSAEFRRSVRRRLLERANDPDWAPNHPTRSTPCWNRNAVLYALALVAVLLFSVGGVVAAATSSLPGHPLYPVKRWTEAIEGQISGNGADAAFRHAELARRRLDEAKALARYGENELADQTVSDYEDEINSAVEGLKADQPNHASGTAGILRKQLAAELEELRAFQLQVPAGSVPVVKHAETATTRVINQLDAPSGD